VARRARRYGAISAVSNTAFVAAAYHNSTSDDFNPSIGVADAGTNVIYAWVNWAYTDTSHSVATSATDQENPYQPQRGSGPQPQAGLRVCTRQRTSLRAGLRPGARQRRRPATGGAWRGGPYRAC